MVSKELKERVKSLEPTIRIGKSGLTQSQIEEIKKQLKKRKLVKIKFLRSFIENKDKKKEIEKIAKETKAEIINPIGFTFALYKR